MHFAATSFFLMVFVLSITGGTHHVHQSCDANAICIGYYAGFNCTCNRGYKGSEGGCINIDECVETPEVCINAETCTDIIGSYNCTCGDINTICHHAAVCTEGYNATVCLCIEGYNGNGTHCHDVDECIERSDNCSADALCTNTEGSYECQCYRGFEGDGFVCTDIDECETETHECQQPLRCNNTRGSYDCVCGDHGICDTNGFCNEVDNTTSCYCNPGYTGDGLECLDIDECGSENDCHEKATCINAPGSYSCACIEGFNGDGKIECSGGSSVAISLGVLVLMLASSLLSADSLN